MTTYNFKKETKVYVVKNNNRYALDVYPDLSYSQTFDETPVPVKTLHEQYNMFENATINKANPANFSFTVPILYESYLDVLYDLLLDYDYAQAEAVLKTADLYFVSNSEIHKIEKCVIESGIFQIQNSAVLTASFSGTGSKLTKVAEIPGNPVPTNTRTFGRVTAMEVKINDIVQKAITAVTLEVRNNVSWLDFATLQAQQSTSHALGTRFPEAFVVSNRALTGTIQQYLTNETRDNAQSWAIGSAVRVAAGELGKDPLLVFNIPQTVYTNRLEVQDVYIQSYEFRMISNPTQLSSVVIKTRS